MKTKGLWIRLFLFILLTAAGTSCSRVENAWKSTKRKANHLYENTKVLLALQECSKNADCSKLEQKWCHPKKKKCVACLSNQHCPQTSPLCNTASGACVQCQRNQDCQRLSSRRKLCVGQQCLECLQNKDCKAWQLCSASSECKPNPNAFASTTAIAFVFGLLFPLMLLLGAGQPQILVPLGFFGLVAGPIIGWLAPAYLGLSRLAHINTLMAGLSIGLGVGLGALLASRWEKSGVAVGLLLQSGAYHLLLSQSVDLVGPNPTPLKLFVLSNLLVSLVLFSLSIGASKDGKTSGQKGKTVWVAALGALLTAAGFLGLILQVMGVLG